MTPLAWSLLAFGDGFNRTGLLPESQALLAWGADYLLSCWNAANETFVTVRLPCQPSSRPSRPVS